MAAAAAGAAAIAHAIKASGVIVQLEPSEFLKLLEHAKEPLVVRSGSGFFTRRNKYMFGHKGLCFYTSSAEELTLPVKTEVVYAEKIWIPG